MLDPLSFSADVGGLARFSGLSDNSPVPVVAVFRVLVLLSYYTFIVYTGVSSKIGFLWEPSVPSTRGLRPVQRPAYIRVRVMWPYSCFVAASSVHSPSWDSWACFAIPSV